MSFQICIVACRVSSSDLYGIYNRIGYTNKYQVLTDYQDVYTGEIFQKSQCIWHENVMLDWMRSQLLHLGYHSLGSSNKVWQRDDRIVVACVVDDITTCSASADPYVPALWNEHVTVITDNRITCPTQYSVHQLPDSWFGIYAYDLDDRLWQPDRRFNFSVNRLDLKRMLLFLEHRRRLPWTQDREIMDYVNFNCWAWDGDNNSDHGFAANFESQWQRLDDSHRTAYQETYDASLPAMPYRNHQLDHDTVMYQSWINLVIETYSGDSVIAVSEKTFRALVTPVPWQVYSGRYTVVYLESLGFDCMSDIVDHSYDAMIETRTVDYGDKIVDWFWKANENYARLQTQDFRRLSERCLKAAQHNKQVLKTLRKTWPLDLATWWPQVVKAIS